MSMRTFRKRLHYWMNRSLRARDLAGELETHRSLPQARFEERGFSAAEAAEASHRALGNMTLAREDARDVWAVRWLDGLIRDVRHGIRLLRRNPGFTLAAVLSLSLGIGANTAIFSLIDAVVLQALPVEKPEQLVVLERVNTRGERSNLSYQLFDSLRTSDLVFSGAFAALDGTYRVEVDGRGTLADGDAVRVQAVSGEYFQVLGVQTTIGRPLTPEDDRVDRSEPVAVISHGFWQRRFRGDASVIGRRLTLKHEPVTIVGVAPVGFFGESVGRVPDLWVPLTLQPKLDPPDLLNDPRVGWLRVMARLQPEMSLTQAQAAMRARLQGLKADAGPLGQALRQVSEISVEPGRRGLADTRARFSQQLWILMAVVGVVLLIACANVANLLLVRSAARRQETAIRLAIGAGRGRLVRQFLTESALLAFLSGSVGVLLAWWGSQVLLVLASDGSSPLAIDVTPNVRILAFTFTVSLVTVLLFGLAPASAATRQDTHGALKTASKRSRLTLPRVLIAVQIGLSLLLLTGAGLLLQTLKNLRTVDLGFAADEIVQVAMNPRPAGYSREQLPDLYRRLLARFESVPGIRSTSMATSGFGGGTSRTCCIAIQGHIPLQGEEREVRTTTITPDYFRTMGVPLLNGRAFSATDIDPAASESPKVAIINEAMARQYFGSVAVVGRRFGWGDSPRATYNTEVVGVARNALYGDLRQGPRPLIYYPTAGGRYLIVRAGLPVSAIAGLVGREIHAVDPNLDANVQTVPQIRDRALVLERMLARLSGFFSIAALLLAGIGLYGVMAYGVARRTKEIGIRVALGAQRHSVVQQVFSETLGLVVVGILFGAAAALMATRLLTSTLFGVTPSDPLTLGLAMLVLIVVAALAGVVPARRAARVEPSVALRHE
jgi:predicted permease